MNARARGSFLFEQGRVIKALIIREIYTRFGRENIGFGWIVVEPILFTLAVIILWSAIAEGKGGVDIPIVEFLLTGYLPILMYRHCVIRLLRCMQANSDLLYHRQVTIFSMYIARLIVEILGALAAFIVTASFFILWGIADLPVDVPMMLAGFGVYALFSVAIAILIGALSERSEVVEKIWAPISYISVPLSGVFYMVYWLPPEIRDVIKYVPMVTGVELIRGGYFGPGIPVYFAWESAVLTSLVILGFGLLMLRQARDHVEIV